MVGGEHTGAGTGAHRHAHRGSTCTGNSQGCFKKDEEFGTPNIHSSVTSDICTRSTYPFFYLNPNAGLKHSSSLPFHPAPSTSALLCWAGSPPSSNQQFWAWVRACCPERLVWPGALTSHTAPLRSCWPLPSVSPGLPPRALPPPPHPPPPKLLYLHQLI